LFEIEQPSDKYEKHDPRGDDDCDHEVPNRLGYVPSAKRLKKRWPVGHAFALLVCVSDSAAAIVHIIALRASRA
jgi:hypothetical protein